MSVVPLFAFGIYSFVAVQCFQHVAIQDFIYGVKTVSGVYLFFIYPLSCHLPAWGSKVAL